jgi:sugar lactone lactonase YvrE
MNLSSQSRTRRARTPALIAGISTAILAVAGCSSSTAPKTGSLDVTVVAPTGVTGNITVSGPSGYSKSISATTTLTGLAPGSYSVSAANVVAIDPIVGNLETATVSGSPVTVTAGKAAEAATVTYTVRAGSGGLWVAGYAGVNVISELSSAQLAAGTSSAPAITLTTPTSEFVGIAFDANGNMWTSRFDSDTLIEYPAAALAATGTPSRGVVLANSGIQSPAAVAFDGNGNLWVVSYVNNTVSEFTASQLTSSGSPTPAVVISATGGSMNQPLGAAFDASGDLWVVSDNSLVEYAPSQLAATGAPTPTVTIGGDGSNSLNEPLALAFDASGGLWVSNGNTSPFSVVGYRASQLTASGSPVPAVTLTPSGSSLANPAGLAFDASGNLWVANVSGASPIVEFSASQLTNGSPTPNITVTSAGVVRSWGIAFNPHASALPIKP